MDSRHEPQPKPRATGAADARSDQRTVGNESCEQEDFIAQTVSTWQKRTTRKLTREDGRQIAENLLGFFHVLQEWEHAGGCSSNSPNKHDDKPVSAP